MQFKFTNQLNTKTKKAFGLLAISLTLGATGALVTQNSSVNITRQSSRYSPKNSLLSKEALGLKTNMFWKSCPSKRTRYGRCEEIKPPRRYPMPWDIPISWGVANTNTRSKVYFPKIIYGTSEDLKYSRLSDYEKRLKKAEQKLLEDDEKLSDLQSQIDELKGIRANTEKTNKHLEEIKELLEEQDD